MKKLTTVLLAAAALTTAVSAEGNNAGFYLGANAGVANTNVKYSYSSVGATTTAGAATQNYNSTAGKMGGLFGVFAGYGMVLGQGAYVGGEVYGGFDTTKVTPYNDSATTVNGFFQTTVKRSNYYGLAARVGYMITPSTLAYVRLGVEAGKWTAQVVPNQASFAAQVAAGGAGTGGAGASSLATLQQTTTATKKGINFAPGLGFETYLNKNLFVRAEYSYLFGPTIHLSQNTNGLPNAYINGTSLAHTLKISQQSFKLGIGYKF